MLRTLCALALLAVAAQGGIAELPTITVGDRKLAPDGVERTVLTGE